MENELLLKSIEKLLDKKLDPINKRLDKIDVRLSNLEDNQKTILKFVTEADSEFMKLEEKTKDMEKIKRVINVSNIK